MKTLLWIDDIRNPFVETYSKYLPGGYVDLNDYEIIWVVSYDDFVKHIAEYGLPEFISFDHDLGKEKSGYDCAKFLVDYCIDRDCATPKFAVHSDNVVGAENILKLLNNYNSFYYENKNHF